MIIVTGGAGFIGSNIIKHLNKQKHENILVIDNLKNGKKFINLINLKISDYMDKTDFIKIITSSNNKFKKIQAIFHEGACSSTTIWNGKYVIKNNYQYSKDLLHFCLKKNIPFLYASSASVYGHKTNNFIEHPKYENPLNIYGYSKFLFDQHVRSILPKSKSQIFGSRYFNVYGPHEKHKKNMASMILQIINHLNNNKPPVLFQGSENFSRDFIYIDDAVRINLWAWKNNISGIFNIGTGNTQSFTQIAYIILKLYNKQHSIKYIDFPKNLQNYYQTFTKANITKLKNAGYKKKFLTITEGIKKYISWLQNNNK